MFQIANRLYFRLNVLSWKCLECLQFIIIFGLVNASLFLFCPSFLKSELCLLVHVEAYRSSIEARENSLKPNLAF